MNANLENLIPKAIEPAAASKFELRVHQAYV